MNKFLSNADTVMNMDISQDIAKKKKPQEGSKGDQWQIVQKNNGSKSKSKPKGPHAAAADPSMQTQNTHQSVQMANQGQGKEKERTVEPGKDNIPEISLIQEESEEGEINQELENKDISKPPSPKDTNLCPTLSYPPQKDHISSPLYVDMTKRKPPELSISSEEVFFEKSRKK